MSSQRPRTSSRANRGAGYSLSSSNSFHDKKLSGSLSSSLSMLQNDNEVENSEYEAKKIEKNIHYLIEESANYCLNQNYIMSLEKANEAVNKLEPLKNLIEDNDLEDHEYLRLKFSAHFNLALQLQKKGMYSDALEEYNSLVNIDNHSYAGRIRVNMGNIYAKQENYNDAIRMYKMAMDEIGDSPTIQHQIYRNIGNCYIKLKKYQQATQTYEAIMDNQPDMQSGFNLIVCYYALGDREKMKKGFQMLLNIGDDAYFMDETNDDNSLDHNNNDLLNDYINKKKKNMKNLF